MRIGFYISGSGTRLQHFLQEAAQNELEDIQVIISDYPIGHELSRIIFEKNLKSEVFNYDTLVCNGEKKSLVLSNYILKALNDYKIDYCFSFGSHILSGRLLDIYKNKIINFHPSILPMYPGLKSIDQAINQGNTFLLGNTAHFIDSGVDTGPVIMQSVIPTKAFLDSGKNYDIVLDIQVLMLHKLFFLLKKDALTVESDGSVSIMCGDYSNYEIFPFINETSNETT